MGDRTEKPTWLVILFGIQALGWLAQSGFGCLFTLYSTSYPEGPRIAYLVLQLVLALAAAVVFIAGIARPLRGTVLRRVAFVHAFAGMLVTAPFVVLSFAHAYGRFQRGDIGETLGSVVFALASFIVVLGAVSVSRKEQRGWQIFALVVGVLWLLAGALFMLGAGVGVAGISA